MFLSASPFVSAAAQNRNAVYTAYFLKPGDIGDLLALQDVAVRETETAGKGHFLRRRGEQDILAHLEAGQWIIGIKNSQGQHIAHALLTDPQSPAARNLDGYPVQPGDLVVQTFYIRQEDRFTNLDAAWRDTHNPGLILFEKAHEIAAAQGYSRLLAKIAQDNKSQKTFRHNGFAATGDSGCDAKIGYSYQYFAADVQPHSAAQCLAEQAQPGVSLRDGGSAILFALPKKGSPYVRP